MTKTDHHSAAGGPERLTCAYFAERAAMAAYEAERTSSAVLVAAWHGMAAHSLRMARLVEAEPV